MVQFRSMLHLLLSGMGLCTWSLNAFEVTFLNEAVSFRVAEKSSHGRLEFAKVVLCSRNL